MDKIFQAAVIGAGPAGASAALYLARQGVRVALIDQAIFPRDKACGDGIPFKTVRLLEELGISRDALFANGKQISRMQLFGPRGTLLEFTDQTGAGGKNGCIPRKHFDNLLFEKAAQSCTGLFQGHRLIDLQKRSDHYDLIVKDKNSGRKVTVQARLIIGADGGNSRVARLTNLLPRDAAHHFDGLRGYYLGENFGDAIRIFYDPRVLPGYVWIFPVADNMANVGIMTRRKKEKQPGWLQDLFYEVLNTNSLLRPFLQSAQPVGPLRGAPMPLGTLKGSRTGDGVMLIGDAAGFIHPVTGGGIYWAILSAKKAAQVAAQALSRNDVSQASLREYERWWRRTIQPGFKYSARLLGLLSDQKNAGRIFSLAVKYQPVANLFGALYGKQLPRLVWLNPFFWKAVLLSRQ